MASWNDITNTQTNQTLANYYRMKAAKSGQPYNVLNTAPVKEEKREKNGGGGWGGFWKGLGYYTTKLGGGIIRGLEGITDYVVGGVADLIGQDEFAEKLMKNDWLEYDAWDEIFNPSKGHKFAGNVASGVGGMLPSIGITALTGGAAGTAAFATQAAGQSTSEAVKKTGELGGKEWLYGTASGVAEAVIEKASGGIGGSKVGQVFGKHLGKTTAGKIGVSFVSEGLEEVASDLLDPALQRWTGVDKNAQWDLKELPKTFAVGGATGAVMGALGTGVSAVAEGGINNVRARENATELSERLSSNNAEQAKGKKVIYKEKDIAETTERLSKNLQKMNSEKRREFLATHQRIGQFFNEDGTVKRIDRIKADELQNYDNEAYSASLRGREGTFAFKPVAKDAAASQEARKAMKDLEIISKGKADIVLTEEDFGTTASGKKINALVQDGVIYLNAKASAADRVGVVAAHELMHILEGTNEYSALQDFVKAQIQTDSSLAEKYSLQKYLARYAGAQSQQYSNATRTYEAETEIVADFIANEVMSKPEVVQRLINKDRNIVIRMLEWVRSAIKSLGMSKQERGEYAALRKMESYLSAALDAGTGGVKLSDVEKAYQKRAQEMAQEQSQESQKAKEKPITQVTGKLADARFSIEEIIGESGKNYGIGVVLDSELLSNLTEQERIKMVKEYVKELGGTAFTAYDTNENKVSIYIARANEKYINARGKRKSVNEDLTKKYIQNPVKQDSIALVDELILTSKYDGGQPANYSHGWLDNNGKNDWEYWKTYLLDKENTIWEATLNIANTTNGEKVLYDINPIKKVERSVESDTLSTNNNIAHQKRNVNSFSQKTSENFSERDKAALEDKKNRETPSARFSLQYADEIAENQMKTNEEMDFVVDETILEQGIESTARMVEMMSKHKDILPEDKIGKVLKSNSSYDKSVENTTICVRTLSYNQFVDMVQEKVGRPLTQAESFLVSQKLYEIALEPQCLYCYVSLDRKAYNEFLLRYIKERDDVIEAYKASDKKKTTIEKLYEDYRNGRKSTEPLRKRFDMFIEMAQKDIAPLTASDISTKARQSEIAARNDFSSIQWKDMAAYAQSASWAKKQVEYAAYYNDILKLSQQAVNNLNKHYGLRFYSFSDYTAAFIVENMQQVTDASIRGLKGLGYTKDTDFAKIFAPTGMNINISMYAHKNVETGEWEIDPRQSADLEEAKALRAKYPNVGIVVTASTDEGVLWALKQEWSDIVIPFHIVRTGADVAEFYKWQNFTSESGDTIADENLWKEYVGNRKKVSKNIYPSEHQNNKDIYFKLINERGLKPRFERFKDNPNYMKLVNETRRAAKDTPPMQPIFDLAEAEKSFNKFVGKGGYFKGWYKEGVDVNAEAEVVAEDVKAGRKANEVDYGRQDINPEEMMKKRKAVRSHSEKRFSIDIGDENVSTSGNQNGSRIFSKTEGNRRLSIDDSLEAKYLNLNLDQEIKDIYKAPAVKLNDGSIVPFSIVKDRPKGARYNPAIPKTTAEQTLFIQQNKIAAKDLESVGWIVNGQYNVTREVKVAQPLSVTTKPEKVKLFSEQFAEEVKKRTRQKWIISQMAFTNNVAGLEDAGDHLGINLRPKVQKARSAKAAALNMIANKQTDRNGNIVGESLAEIFKPIQSNKKRTKKENDAYTVEFYEYLLNYLNEDRMSMEANAKKEMQALAQKHKSIRDLLDQGLEEDDLRHYLKKTEEGKKYVQLMDVRNKPVFTDADSVVQVTAEESKQRREELEKAHPEFKEHAEKVWKYNQNLLQRRVDAGLLTQEQADDLNKKYPHYVPTFRDMEGAPGTGISGTKKTKYNIEVKKTITTAKGSSLDILDISLMMSKQTQQVLQAEAQNEIANELYDAAVRENKFRDVAPYKVEDLQEALNESQDVDIDYGMENRKQNEIIFYKDGKRITMAVSPLVYESMQALNPPVESVVSSNIFAKLMRGWMKLFKTAVTSWNPLFTIANSIRDLQEAIFYTRNSKLKFIGSYLKNFVTFNKKNNELWQKYLAMGGAESGYFNKETGVYDRRSKFKKALYKIPDAIEKVNWYVEQIPRFTEFALAVKSGKSLEEALLYSADVTTNFSRGGVATKWANSMFMPFLNPSVQGWSKLWRTFAEPISGMTKVGITKLTKTAEGRKALREFGGLIVKSIIVGMAVGLFNDLMWDDDDDYENISQNIKDNYYLFKAGDKFIRIPKGRVVALFGSVADRIKKGIEGEEVSFGEWFSSASQMVSPVESASRTIFSPFTDVKTNTTWYGGKIESQSLQNYAPSQRYDESTSSIAIFLGDVFNYSPKKIHYLIDQYTGVIGDVILPMTTQKAERDMFTNRFVVDPVLQNDISTEFYSLLDEAMYAKNAGDYTATLRYRYLSQVSNSVSDMYKQKREIEGSSLSNSEKQKQVRIIQALINETLLSASENVDDFEQILIDNGYDEAVAKMMQDKRFKAFDEKQQTSAAQKLSDYFYAQAFRSLNGEQGEIKYQMYDAIGGANTAVYLTEIASIQSDKDRTGKTIPNSRKEKVHKYIEKLSLTASQKYMLMYLAGYAPSDTGKRQITNYLVSKGYQKEAVEDLWN